MTDELYALAAGHNVAEGSLVRIYTINPGDGDFFDPPKGLPLYDGGEPMDRLDDLLDEIGWSMVSWYFTRMSYSQYAYLRSTYCAGGLSGYVTIYTTLGSDSWVRRNAIMKLPQPAALQSEYRYQRVSIDFTKLKVPT